MDYNTNRGDMLYREYGRTITKIIEEVCAAPDGASKEEATRAIVYVMSQVAGVSIKDDVSYHKLWDHLMVLSDFRLEKSWPFTAEELELLKQKNAKKNEKPEKRLPYKDEKISIRQYGAYLESMMKKLPSTPEGDEYDALVTLIAQQTKRSYLAWNGELADDNIIVDHIARISGDGRVVEKLRNKRIVVPSNTLPVDVMQPKKKQK